MNPRLSTILSGALATVSILLILGGILFAYLQYAKYDPPYAILNPQAHFATTLGDDALVVGREFSVTKRTDFTVTRELLRQTPDATVRIELPWTRVEYGPGKHSIQRIYAIPKIAPGIYELHNRLCWPANVLRTDCLDLPVLTVEIFPERK